MTQSTENFKFKVLKENFIRLGRFVGKVNPKPLPYYFKTGNISTLNNIVTNTYYISKVKR